MRMDHGKWPRRKWGAMKKWGSHPPEFGVLAAATVSISQLWPFFNNGKSEKTETTIPGSIVSGMMLWKLQATEFPTFWTSSAEYPGSVDVAMGLWNGWSYYVGETLELKITSRMVFFKHMFCPVGTYNMCRFQIVMKKVCNWVPSKLN